MANEQKRKIQLETDVDVTPLEKGFQKAKSAAADMAEGLIAAGDKAGKKLDELAKTATRTSEEVRKAEKEMQTPGGATPPVAPPKPSGGDKEREKAPGIAEKMTRAERSLAQSIERTTAAFSAGSKSSSEYYRVLAQQRGIDPKILQPYLDALDKVAPKQKQVADAVMATVPAMQKYEMSAKATAAALRQVPAQFTDIVVGLQGGQAPLTVLLQQGGQLRDVFGSTGGAVKALGGFLLTLLTPLNIALTAVGLFGLAFVQGRKEAEEFNKALILTGNFAGTTAGSLQVMASSVAAATGATKGAAAEALTAFAASGEVGSASFEKFAATAIRVQRETGVAVADTVKQFVALGKDPVSASAKLNETTNYLTLSVYKQIKALEDQGKSSEAAALAQKAYFDAMDTRTTSLEANLGSLEQAWRVVAGAAKGAWDAMLNVGREESTETKIKAITDRLAELAKGSQAGLAKSKTGLDLNAPERKSLEEQLGTLKEIARFNDRAARVASQNANDTKKRIEFDRDSAKVSLQELTLTKELATAKNKYFGDIAKGLITQKEYDNYIAGIRKRYTDTGAVSTKAQLDKAEAGLRVQEIEQAYARQANAYANGDRILESLRSAGVLDDARYFEFKRASADQLSKLEEKAINEEIARESQRQIIGATADARRLQQIDRDKKVAELRQRLALSQANSANASVLLGLQESATSDKIAKSFQDARTAAQQYFDSVELGYARTLAAKGRGDAANARDAGRNQIIDKYDGDRNAANRRFQAGPDNQQTRDELQQTLNLTNVYQEKALAGWEQYYSKLKTADGEWSNGAQRSVETYLDGAANMAKMTESVFTNAFQNMEDSLVTFVTTGKLNFSKFADSLVADITRIIIKQQILAPLSGALSGGSGLGGLFTTIFGAAGSLGAPPSGIGFGARANGGPVSAGSMYEVNERGPELLNVAGKQYLMMGNQPGSVTPNSGIGGNTVNINVNQSFAAGTSRATTLQAAADARRQLELAGRNL